MNLATSTLENLQAENQELKGEIVSLQEQLDWFKRQIFGKRSEKIVLTSEENYFPGFPWTADKVSEKEKKKTMIPAHERKTANRDGQDKITWPSDLPVEKVFIDLPEDQKVCPETGVPLVKIGEEKTSKLALQPGTFYIKEIIRPKYAHPQRSEEGIKIAALPETLLTRCQADESLLAEILVKKFADHLPLNRMSEIFARQGVFISRQILCQWVMRCGEALKPLYDLMHKEILASGNVFIDETPVKMLVPGKGEAQQAFMWVLSGGNAANPAYRIYSFRPNRQHRHAAELLKGFHGVLHSDKYGAYEVLANAKQFIWCPCWVHIRRNFLEAESGDPPFRDWVLGRIQELFKLEEEAWLLSPEERLCVREQKEVPIIDNLIHSIKDRLVNGKTLPKSNFKDALGYFVSLIPYLKNYTLLPWARLDNNVAERAVRSIAVGRKNWLFVGSEDGGEAAAILFSLIQTCRAIKINPVEYLQDIMVRLMSHSSQKLHELLPDHWAQSKK